MADRQMRLTAKVVDEMTPALRRIKGAIAELKKTPRLEGLGKQMEGLTKQVERFSKGGAEAALATGSLGLSALAAGGGILALSAKFKQLALAANTLKELSRETGLTIDQLNQLQHVAPQFGVSADEITKAMQTWADKMVDVRRGWGDVVSQLNGQGLGDFVRKLQRDNPAQALKDMFDLLGSDKLMANPALQKRWTQEFFGDGGLVPLFQKGAKGIDDAWAQMAANLDKVSPDLARNANAERKGLVDLQAQIGNLENTAAPPIFGLMAKGFEEAASGVGLLNAGLKELLALAARAGAKPGSAIGALMGGSIGGVLAGPAGALAGGAAGRAIGAPIGGAVHGVIGAIRREFAKPPVALKGDTAADRQKAMNDLGSRLSGGLAHPMAFSGGGNGLLQLMSYRTGASAGVGAGGSFGFSKAVELGVFRGLVDFENRTQLNTLAAKVAGAPKLPKLREAAYEAGGGYGGGYGGGPPMRGQSIAPGVPRTFRKAPGAGSSSGGGSGAQGTSRLAPSGEVGGMSTDPILNEISKAEGTRGYNDSFGHQLRGDLSKDTLAQIQQIQRHMHGSSAIGRYQFMRNTLFGSRGHPGLVQQLGIGMDQKFTPALQEKMATALLQRRGYSQWMSGKMSDSKFMSNLSHEWAGLTDPRTGRGVYPGQTTGHSVAEEMQSLDRARELAQGRNLPNVLDLAGKAGLLEHRVHHEGGADIRVRFEGGPPVRGVTTSTSGMIRSAQVNRGISMEATPEA